MERERNYYFEQCEKYKAALGTAGIDLSLGAEHHGHGPHGSHGHHAGGAHHNPPQPVQLDLSLNNERNGGSGYHSSLVYETTTSKLAVMR